MSQAGIMAVDMIPVETMPVETVPVETVPVGAVRPVARAAGSLQETAHPPPIHIVAPPGAEALAARLLAACAEAGRPAGLAVVGQVAGAAIVVDLSQKYRAHEGQEVWRLRAGVGLLHGRLALSASWHRPPYWVAVVLTRTVGEADPQAGGTAVEDIVGRAHIGATGTLRALQDKAAATAAILLRRALSGQPSPGPASDDRTSDELAVRFGPDGVAALVGGWLRRQGARWRDRLTAEWWSVGICERPIAAILRDGQLGTVTWLRAQRGDAYWADPFPWPGTPNLLVEECAVSGGPGTIVVLRPSADGGWERDRVLLGDAWHRSYPSTFVEEDQVYLLPECLRAGGTELYRLHRSGRIDAVATVARTALADPTLFRHGGRFWVAGTDVAIGVHDNLCLFHADRLDGPWRAHPGNPVKIDIRSSRPAGTPFRVGARLFRPAQDCAGTYGAAVVVNEILTLNPSGFAERPAVRLAPAAGGPLPHGMHTLAAAGPRTLVDGKRIVWAPRLAAGRAIRRLGWPGSGGR